MGGREERDQEPFDAHEQTLRGEALAIVVLPRHIAPIDYNLPVRRRETPEIPA